MGKRNLKVLYVTYEFPYPPHSGARLRDLNLIKRISRNHSISLLALVETQEEVQHLSQLKRYCDMVEVVVTRRRSKWEHLPGVVRCLLEGRPLDTYFLYYDEMATKILETVITRDIDILQIEHSDMALYIENLPADSRCKRILDFHNVLFDQYRKMLHLRIGLEQKLRYLLGWLLALRWEPKCAEQFDHCLVVSPVDDNMLQSANPNLAISMIENGVDTELIQPLTDVSEDDNLLFVGNMNYAPNLDAVWYFCNDIFPLIQRDVPNAKLIVVGGNPTLEIRRLAAWENVLVTGHVPDIIPYYQHSRASVVPLRAGAGTRLKILESMALGRPVVSTTVGCEGLSVVDGEHLLVANEPEQFAEKTVRLLTDKTLYQRIAANARQLVETRYDWDVIAGQLMQVYAEMVE